MLYVFQVDTGRMMTFDMSLALESVQNLKLHVERACGVPIDKQVLLISGGEHLNPDDRVCSHPTGTDTNPIFLFSKAVMECNDPPQACVDSIPDPDMKSKVREAIELPVSYSTVQKRTSLAKLFHDLGHEQLKLCEKLVHEQHVQQQGWSAVVANLEDLSYALKERWAIYQTAFDNYMQQRASYIDCLNVFKDDLLVLKKIPLLPALIESQKAIFVPENDEIEETETSTEETKRRSLLEWISEKDDVMDCLYEICLRGINQINESDFMLLTQDIERSLTMTDDQQMKEVKGLGDRLFGLEELMVDVRRYVQEQLDLSKSFERNNTRAAQVREASILPDLCATHVQQLQVLLKNHLSLRDITRRCKLAKEELSSNLFCRLKWIVYVEGQLSELDNKLVFKYQNLSSLQRQLEILEQVHSAPAIFVSAVAEVVRRRHFSQSFLVWASDLACNLLTIYTEEVNRRKDFQATFENHFLSSLFPGMDDVPPAFATQAPSIFDSELPKLTNDDNDKLKDILPELVGDIKISQTSTSGINFFLPKETVDKASDNRAMDEKLIEVVQEAGLASNMDQNLLKAIDGEQMGSLTTPHGLPFLKDLDKGCESETDTEEFEKVSQSPFELNCAPLSPRRAVGGTQDASTLTEDNLVDSRSEQERLKAQLISLARMCVVALSQLKTELSELKSCVLSDRQTLQDSVNNTTITINNVVLQRERESIQRITVDHELEISDFRKIAQGKNEEIKSLRDQNANLSRQLKSTIDEISKLQGELQMNAEKSALEASAWQQKLDDLTKEKNKELKDTIVEYKNEIENIRSRFKLMTDRSPSESSLEKIELTSNDRIQQMRENFESEKELAMNDAIQSQEAKWEKILAEKMKENEAKFQEERAVLLDEVERRISKEKDKQIDALREQMRNLSLECVKYKSTIQQLTETKDEGNNDLEKRVERLEMEKAELQVELEGHRSSRAAAMAASVAVCEGSLSDAATSPIKHKRRIESKVGKLSVDSCKSGEIVLIIWDPNNKNFKIVQESSYLFFLNTDSFESLGIKIENGEPNLIYCFGEVIEKEYCHARKDEQLSVVFQSTNRFRVAQGTKFFRVKAKATTYNQQTLRLPHISALHHSHMTQSHTTSSVDVIAGDEPSKSLPSSPTKAEMTWEANRDAVSPPPSPIPEEKGDDSINLVEEPHVQQHDIEKGTELTENFNVEVENSDNKLVVSIDRVSH